MVVVDGCVAWQTSQLPLARVSLAASNLLDSMGLRRHLILVALSMLGIFAEILTVAGYESVLHSSSSPSHNSIYSSYFRFFQALVQTLAAADVHQTPIRWAQIA